MFWMALLAPLLFQEPADDLRREIEKLKKQTVELQERISLLEQGAVDDAQTIQRLRQVVKMLESNAPTPADHKTPGGPAPKPLLGPPSPIRSKVVFVDVKQGFIAISAGKKDKVEVGYRFQIFRESYENGGETKLTALGICEVEKFLGQDSMAKLTVKEGNIADMKIDDIAVAIRKIEDLPAKEAGKAEAKPEAEVAPKEGVYMITGRTGASGNAGYVINYGTQHGAHQTQLMFAYKDGKFKAKLRLDKVDKVHSVGFVVDGSMEVAPETGDQVYVKELNKAMGGKVALSDEKGGRLAVDLRQRDGVKPGMHCEVRRLGQKIGTIMITEVQVWGSWAKPDGDLKIDQIQKGDFVEVVDEK